ncbi:hypothetical protein AwErysi_06330 [Erysipelotrichaceae bacterium]|nr:hypothetical protein AwErysi_06330 [Erysipelotrichaceae bacterium]
MTNTKKKPLRKCVVSREQFPKDELIRIVKTVDGTIELDTTGRKNGRGAYLKKDAKIVKKAEKSQVLNRHLSTEVPKEIYIEIMELIENESASI